MSVSKTQFRKPFVRKTPINMVIMMIYMILIERIITFLLMTEYLNDKSCWNYLAILLNHFSAPFRLFVCMYHIAFYVFRTFWNVWLFNCWFFAQRESPLPMKGCKFLTYASALMAIEHWGFFSVPHLKCTVYNYHLREPVILTPIAERLAVDLSLPVFTT